MNNEQKRNKITAATTFLYLNVMDITQQSGIFFGDNVKFNKGFEIIYLLTVLNITPILHFFGKKQCYSLIFIILFLYSN